MTTPELDPWSIPNLTERATGCDNPWGTPGVSCTAATCPAHGSRDTGRAQASPAVVGATDRALTSSPALPGEEAGMSILSHQPATTPGVDPEYAARVATEGAFATIERLQRVLERVIRHRDALREENAELLKCARHWFVNDGNGYCLACAVPEANRRHCKRAA